MEYLISSWPKIKSMVQAAKRVLFMSDFDGTLTPIVEKPELAVLSAEGREILRRMVQLDKFTVGIISGRALADLKARVDIEGLILAGNHGFEIEGPGWNFISPIAEEIKPLFRILRQLLSMTLGKIKGVLVEDKGLSLSVHYRHAEEGSVGAIEDMVERVVQRPALRGLIKVTPGKKVYEVKPAVNWNKGKAIRLLMKRYGKGGRQSGLLPIFLGDDVTDEDGFQAINRYGNGIAVYVGEPRGDFSAEYYLNSPQEVLLFMANIIESIRGER